MTTTEHLEMALMKMGVDVDALPDRLLSTLLSALCENVGSGGGTGGMGGADWNAAEGEPGHVLNRTHWVETVTVDPVFDGNLVGHEVMQPMNGSYIVKVSPEYIPVANMVGATFVAVNNGTEIPVTLTAESVVEASAVYGIPGTLALMGTDPVIISFPSDTTLDGLHISAGTWFGYGRGFYVKSLSCLQAYEKEIFREIDPKYTSGVNEIPYAITSMDGNFATVYGSSYSGVCTDTDSIFEQRKKGIIAFKFWYEDINGGLKEATVNALVSHDMDIPPAEAEFFDKVFKARAFYHIDDAASVEYMVEFAVSKFSDEYTESYIGIPGACAVSVTMIPLYTTSIGMGWVAPVVVSNEKMYRLSVGSDGKVTAYEVW